MTCPACVDPERRAQRPRQIIRLATKILGWTWVNSGFYIDARRARVRRYGELWLLQKPVQALTEYHARIEPRARRHRNNAGYALPPADLFLAGRDCAQAAQDARTKAAISDSPARAALAPGSSAARGRGQCGAFAPDRTIAVQCLR